MTWHPREVRRTIPTLVPSSTKPFHVVTDEGNGFLKMPDNPQGPSALVSEHIGTQLADWIGLEVFQHAVITVSEADLDPESNVLEPVPAFITLEEDGTPWEGSAKELRKVENIADFSRIVVFDTWVGNFDRHSWHVRAGTRTEHRNDANLFMSSDAGAGQFKLKAYDHTHCQFALIAASPQVDLDGKITDGEIYGLFPEFREFLDRDAVRLAVSQVSEMNERIARQVVQAVPDEWIRDPSARDRLVKFIKCRSEFVSRQIERKLFPQRELFNE